MDGFLIFGISSLYCIDEQFSVIMENTLGETPGQIVESLNRLRQGTKDTAISDFFSNLAKKGVDRFFVESQVFAEELLNLYEVKVLPYEDVRLWRRIRQDFLTPNLTKDNRRVLHDVAMGLSREAIREASEQSDQLVIQAMSSLDDVEKVQNLMGSRLREWYGLHFPEASHAIEDVQTLAKIIAEGGHRQTIADISELVQLLSGISIEGESLNQSMGADISKQDMEMIQALARQLIDLQGFREKLEQYLDESMREIAPNLRGLIGPVIGARLIGLAGGLEKLARFPASTIQVLGAEQALFRALKTGARPPKHGVIFQHTSVHSAPWWQRGKIARILSGKIAIAARIDLFSGEYVADNLKQSVQTRIAEVKRKYPTAPKTPPSTKPPKRPPRRRKKFMKRPKKHSPKKPRGKGRDPK
jgi:nucleolar protein 56